MANALLMLAAAGIGFGRSPWEGFAFGAALIVLFSIPDQREIIRGYRGQPKADIILAMLLSVGIAVAGCFASAWAGYFLAMLLNR